MFEQYSLGPAIALSEGMNDIQITESFGAGVYKLFSFQLLKPVYVSERSKYFFRLRLDAGCRAETGIPFGYVYSA
ncbi:hypothetical protein ALO61_200117 [Pseudomonas savastanoi pv. nerii]|nr:hypothetical protein ALO61_200117 [Pseudomonas savastanoi pv. nerii]